MKVTKGHILLPLIFLGLSICLSSCTDVFGDKPAHASISTGKLRGYKTVPRKGGHIVNVFKAVPFAEPPIGKRRFRRATPVKPWIGTVDATKYSPACPSNTTRTTSPQNVTSEDCLYVNVLADETCVFKKDCSVLVVLHGGAFTFDSAIMENLTFLVDNYASKDMIVVIPAFRIGIFGYFDVGAKHLIDSNNGFHDIVLGLQWIQREVHHFGGDPDKVTLYGNSGGGSTIALLSVAPGIELMWRQIIMSGPQTNMRMHGNRQASIEVLKLSNCWSNNSTNETLSPEEQLHCFSKLSTDDIIGCQREADDENIIFHGPEVDDALFYGQTYTQLIDEFKAVPAIFGSTTNEFHVLTEGKILQKCIDYCPVFMYYSDEAVDACNDYYLKGFVEGNNSPITADAIRADLFRLAMSNSRKLAPTYVYSFELDGYNYHSDDTKFMIGLHTMLNVSKVKEDYMLDYMPKMMEKFIKYGIPGDDWPQFQDGQNYKVFDVKEVGGNLRGPYSVRQPYFPTSLKRWLVDLKEIDDVVKYDYMKNRTKEAIRQFEKERELKWERFQEKWKQVQEAMKESYQHYKEKKQNATIEAFNRYKKLQEKKQEEQRFKVHQFVNYLLSESLDEILEKIDEAEEFMTPADSERYHQLEKVKAHIKELQRQLFEESLSPADREKLELDERIKQAVQDTIDDFNNGKGRDSVNEETATEFNFVDPRLKLPNELTVEEWKAAQLIFEEQRSALQSQANETYQHDKERWEQVKENIQKKLNESIAERKDLKDKALRQWNETRQARKEKEGEIAQNINDTKADIAQNINDTKADIVQKINDTKADIQNKKDELKDEITPKINETIEAQKTEADSLTIQLFLTPEERQQKRNETIQKIKDARQKVGQKLADSKTDIEKNRDSVDSKVNETRQAYKEARETLKNHNYDDTNLEDKKQEYKQALDALRNATYAQMLERMDEKRQWKQVWTDIRNQTLTEIFKNVKKFVDEKMEAKKEQKAEFQKYLDQMREKAKSDFAEKVIEKELGLFQGSFIALPPELQTSGGVAPGISNLFGAKMENQRVWSAFWIVLIIAFLLAFTMFAKAIFSWIRPRPKGYFYNEDPGFFNFDENSKIVVATYPKYT